MSRLDPLDPSDIAELKPVLDMIGQQMGFVPNSLLTMARNPDMVRTFAAFAGAVMGEGSVSPELKNMVAQVASKSAGCSYCMAHTGHMGVEGGLPEEKEKDLWLFERSDKFSKAEKAALTVAQCAAQVPNMVSDADFATLREHFSEEQIIEIVAVISLFGFLNRWNDTMATRLEDAPREFAEETLGPLGWSAGKHA